MVFLCPHPASLLLSCSCDLELSDCNPSFSSHDFVLFLLETFSQIQGGYFLWALQVLLFAFFSSCPFFPFRLLAGKLFDVSMNNGPFSDQLTSSNCPFFSTVSPVSQKQCLHSEVMHISHPAGFHS